MSHRQVKKLLNQKKAEVLSESEEEVEEKGNGFFGLDFDEQEEISEESDEPSQCTTHIPAAKKLPKKQEDISDILDSFTENLQSEVKIPEKTSSVLKRRVKNFDPSVESQRLFKEERKNPNRTSHKSGKKLALTPQSSFAPNIEYLLAMEKVSDPTKSIFFFDISKAYSKIHPNYVESIETNDANAVNQFLQRYPFHIEALFQMCMVFQMQGNYEQVGVLIERLLFSFQMSFHYQFSVISNQIEIDIGMNVYNKIFYKVLMMHADCLGRKGCVRAALEVVKLILALSPQQDPMGGLFLIDYYSLRAKKFEYFLHFLKNFMKEFYGYGCAIEIPHLLYSLALCKCLQEGGFSNSIPEFIITDLTECFDLTSSQVLKCAVSWHPEYAQALLKKLGITEFKELEPGKIPDLYAGRSEDLWKPYINFVKSVVSQSPQVPQPPPNFEEILEKYANLDKSEFSFEVRTVIPQDMEVGRPRTRGNLNSNTHSFILFFSTFLPWNYID